MTTKEEFNLAIDKEITEKLEKMLTVKRTNSPGHWFNCTKLNTEQMYDRTQTDENFCNGSVFVCNDNKTVGFLSRAWPVVIYGEVGELHGLTTSGKATLEQELPETFKTMQTLAKYFDLAEVPTTDE